MDNEAYSLDPPVVAQPTTGTNGQSKGLYTEKIIFPFISTIINSV